MSTRLIINRVTIKRGVRVVIDELSLTVAAGEIVGLVGANGCGKSTLLSSIAGVLPPRDGRIEIVLAPSSSSAMPSSTRASNATGSSIDGAVRASVWGSSRQRALARRAMGYVPEGADPPGFLRAEELWALCAASRGVDPPRARAPGAASSSSTPPSSSTAPSSNTTPSSSTAPPSSTAPSSSDAPSPSPVLLDMLVDALGLDEVASLALDKMSLGQRRRACLGAAFLGPPALLVLDEPDNGLDVKRLANLAALVKLHAASGGATILASHDAAWLDTLDARRIEMASPAR
ncbi:MAG: ATP-binding cassette domain-containing protein [Kofleriaceae bacterium]